MSWQNRNQQCRNKVRHKTQQAAQQARAHLTLMERDDQVDVYSCPWCGGWHVGRARKKPPSPSTSSAACPCGGRRLSHVAPRLDLTAEVGCPVDARNVPCYQCDRCGELALLPEVIHQVARVLARDLLGQQAPLAPREVRFLRTHAQLSQRRLAKMLGVAGATLRAWEDGAESAGLDERLREVLRHHLGESAPAG